MFPEKVSKRKKKGEGERIDSEHHINVLLFETKSRLRAWSPPTTRPQQAHNKESTDDQVFFRVSDD